MEGTLNMADTSTKKPIWCPTTCFTVFIIISLLTHITEVFLNSVYIFYVYTDTVSAEWTTTTLGFLLLPVVVIHLFSALLHLQWRASKDKDARDKQNIAIIAILHVLQLGFIWRYLRILNERNSAHRKKFLVDLLLLRLVFAFISSLPLLLLQTYYILNTERYHGIQLAAMIVCLLSTSWALASFRRQNEFCDIDKVILTWPGTVFRWLWRIGEVTARILSLVVFATAYHYWTFLVLGLHWLTMLVCIWAAILATVDRKDFSRGSHVMICIAIGYVYTFTHLNFNNHRAKCRYITYYSIIFLETCVLVAAWLLSKGSVRNALTSYFLIAAIGSAFLLSLASMSIYYGCFHIPVSKVPKGNSDVCIQDGCINCKLSLCAKHNKVLQRPFNAGWASQYQEAVFDGHYYKNVLQDSLLDSASELDERFRGNSSLNDREVEMIMKSESEPKNSTGSKSHSRNVKAEVEICHSNPTVGGVLHNSSVASKPNSIAHISGTTTSTTSTLKSSLDLYNNLNSIQRDKSYESSSFVKGKSLRQTPSFSNTLMKVSTDHHDGEITHNRLSGYNLTVSSIGTPSKDTRHKSVTSESSVLKTEDLYDRQHIGDSSVEDNNGIVLESDSTSNSQAEASPKGNRASASASVCDSTGKSASPSNYCLRCSKGNGHSSCDKCVHSRTEQRIPNQTLTPELSDDLYETDSDSNPEMII